VRIFTPAFEVKGEGQFRNVIVKIGGKGAGERNLFVTGRATTKGGMFVKAECGTEEPQNIDGLSALVKQEGRWGVLSGCPNNNEGSDRRLEWTRGSV